MSLPWNRFEEQPEEELPYVPPPPSPPAPPVEQPPYSPPAPPVAPPSPRPGVIPPDQIPSLPKHAAVDWSDILDDAWPVIKDQLLGYVQGTIKAGFDVDHAHPTVTATTAEGKKLVVADARNRSARTLIQGLIFDLFAALVAAIALLSGMDPLQKETWIAFGVLLMKSFVSAGISYFMRLRVTPTVRTQGEKMQVMPVMVPKPTEDESGA